MWNSDVPQRLAEQCVRRACAHLTRSQEADGSWRVPPLPPLLENALACLVAEAFVPELPLAGPGQLAHARNSSVDWVLA